MSICSICMPIAIEQAGEGIDTVYSSVSLALDNLIASTSLISGEVENPILANGWRKAAAMPRTIWIITKPVTIRCGAAPARDTLQGGDQDDVSGG